MADRFEHGGGFGGVRADVTADELIRMFQGFSVLVVGVGKRHGTEVSECGRRGQNCFPRRWTNRLRHAQPIKPLAGVGREIRDGLHKAVTGHGLEWLPDGIGE